MTLLIMNLAFHLKLIIKYVFGQSALNFYMIPELTSFLFLSNLHTFNM